ncbi:hypothetical protein QAD02_011503 [Eretmocerus hayati]|uniref:Uncharacterized protein n=1 Tax=Eretmocerus hayati TaxID=131215 RepID=A0ACC2NZU5_9HYME|nr:hypothetical protein QAD02_011503 [Eretmocerus hayati]
MSRKYCVRWESDPRFAEWLTRDPQNKDRRYCKLCRRSLGPVISTLKKHASKHPRKNVTDTDAMRGSVTHEEANLSGNILGSLTGEDNAEEIPCLNDSQLIEHPNVEHEGILPSTDSTNDIHHNCDMSCLQLRNCDELIVFPDNSVDSVYLEELSHPQLLCTSDEPVAVDIEPETSRIQGICQGFAFDVTPYLEKNMLTASQGAEFAKWMVYTNEEKTRVRCILCQSDLQAVYDSLTHHHNSRKHKINANEMDPCEGMDYQRTMTEMQFVAFIVTKNLSFLLLDELIPFLK